MGYLTDLYNSAKKSLASGLGTVGGVLNKIGSSKIINRIGSFASTAAPYVGAGLESLGGLLGNPALMTAGYVANKGLEYLGSEITSNSQHFNNKLDEYGGNLTTFGKYIGQKTDND